MPAMQGYEEVEAARLTLEFMQGLAKKVEKFHSRLWGLWRPYRFRGRYMSWQSLGKEKAGVHEQPVSLVGNFSIEIAGFSLNFLPYTKWDWIEKLALQSGGYITFIGCTFHRADWDDTPEMRSATCTLYIPELTPPFLHSEVCRFTKTMFGCERVRFFSQQEVKSFIDAHTEPPRS